MFKNYTSYSKFLSRLPHHIIIGIGICCIGLMLAWVGFLLVAMFGWFWGMWFPVLLFIGGFVGSMVWEYSYDKLCQPYPGARSEDQQ